MDRRVYALVSVALGIGLGVTGDLLFYRKPLGISVPLFAAALVAALFVFAGMARSRTRIRNSWVVVPLIFFAVMVAVRADPLITLLNIGAAVWMLALLLYYRPIYAPIDQETLGAQAASVFETIMFIPFETPGKLADAGGWLRERRVFGAEAVRSVARGLLIALPILVVFGLLLASADTIFAGYLTDALNVFSLTNAEDLVVHTLILAGVSWLSCGALAYGVLRPEPAVVQPVVIDDPVIAEVLESSYADVFGADAAAKRKRQPFRLALLESSIVLGAVDLMFGVFVVVQMAYFFGGRSLVTAETGWTFAQYARRGFFELVAVSVLVLGLILWLDRVTPRTTVRQHTVFRVLAVGMIALTGVMLVSASGRMSLYEEAYGYTHLRLYTHTFMLWLGVLLGVVVLELMVLARRFFAIGVTLCAIGFLATLNLMNVDYAIAEQNIARYQHGEELDVVYLHSLSADAVPALVPFFLAVEDAEIRARIGGTLAVRQRELARERRDLSLFSAHYGRDTAWAMIEAIEDELPALP